MPELSDKARKLYDNTWGTATYEEYCDRNGTCHGCVVPDDDALRARSKELSTEPFCHRPHHDVESMFWTLFVSLLKAVPRGDVQDEQGPYFRGAWKALEEHTIGPVEKPFIDPRDNSVLRELVDDGPGRVCNILHPAFECTPLPKMITRLAQHVAPEYGLLEGISKPDHMHEVWRRLLLDCLIEMEDENIDIEFDTQKERNPRRASPYLKRGRPSAEVDPDDDGNDRKIRQRLRTATTSLRRE